MCYRGQPKVRWKEKLMECILGREGEKLLMEKSEEIERIYGY